MNDYINKVGLGMDLDGGESTLSTLRAIRFEYKAIVELNEKAPRQLGTKLSSSNTQQARKENADQMRLFSDGIERQQSLFSNAELEKTRISKRETDKRMSYRKRSLEVELSEEERIERAATQKISKTRFNTKVNDLVGSRNEDNTQKRRNAIVKTMQEQQRLDQEEERADEARSQRRRSAIVKQLQAEREIDRQEEQARTERERRRRPNGRFMSRSELATQEAEEQARQRQIELSSRRSELASGRRRDSSGRFLSGDEVARIEQQEAAAEATRQRRRELNERINQRGEQDRARREEQRARQERERQAREAAERRRAQEIESELVSAGPNRQKLIDLYDEQGRIKDQRNLAKDVAAGRRPKYGPSRDDFIDAEKGTVALNKIQDASQKIRRELSGKIFSSFGAEGKAEAQKIYIELDRLGLRAEELKTELNSVNIKRGRAEVISDLKKIEAEQSKLIEQTRRLRESELRGKNLLNLPGQSTPNLADPKGLLNEKGSLLRAMHSAVSPATFFCMK